MIALRALLEGLIDYAGLFPPASLDIQAAVRNYSEYRAIEHAWMLGRFIVPAQRLDEFATVFAEACCDEQMSPWLLSVLSSGNADEDARMIGSFREGVALLDAIEFKAVDAAQAEQQLGTVPSGMTGYVEFPPQASSQILPVLKKARARAKVRTGGISPDAIPGAEELASFLIACAKAKVPFKATAGLHHPLRSTQKLTYQQDSPSAIMHGFINVFAAAAVAYQGASEGDVLDLLNEQSSSAFQWEKNALKWRNHRLSAKQIKTVRDKFAIGFGSCSFTEPIHDLKALGWL
jgi:hypothetical protein